MLVNWLGGIGFLALAVGNGLLAAAGSAIRNAHPVRLRQMVEENAPGAQIASKVASQATKLLVSLRLGHSVLRLMALVVSLFSFGPLVLSSSPTPTLGLVLVLCAALFIVGMIEFVFENLALREPTVWALRLAVVVAGVELVLSPVIRIMLQLGRRIAQSPVGRQYPLVTEEEIMTLVTAGEEGGILQGEEKAMIYSIFQLDNTLAREVMVPRIDVLAFERDAPLKDVTETLLETGYSRAPVFAESIDEIVGLVYVKDLLAAWKDGDVERSVSELLRPAYFVPEAKRVDQLLTEMQSEQIQMAIVVDEYGGTAGLVTFEDIVEEIVGEVRDEYDFGEELPFQQLGEDTYLFNGGIDLDDVNQLVGADLPKDTSETLGGFIYSHLGRVPTPGEAIDAGGLNLVVEQVVGRRILKVTATRAPADVEAEEVEDFGDGRAS